MARIYNNVTEIIGKTPLVSLAGYVESIGLTGRILGKLEYMNPAGSAKDRAALYMINEAVKNGLLREGGLIVEPTSGNTGIGLAAIAAARGYRVILTMPETMSIERRKLLAAYGAEIVLTEGTKGMSGAIAKAKEIVAENPGAWMPSQFDNHANPMAHEYTTGPEIWADAGGAFEYFVSAVGTGGTVSGVGAYFKMVNPYLQVIGVEPAASPVISGGQAGPHKIQGIGAGFIPGNLNMDVIDEIITVSDEAAFAAARTLAKTDGLLVGISSGAAITAAAEILKRDPGASVVALLPDTGERYLSTELFD